MRLSNIKILVLSSLLMLLPSAVSAQKSLPDSTAVSDSLKYFANDNPSSTVFREEASTRYDKRVHYYRKRWNALIPTQQVTQYAGNMGMFSIGVGWDYGKHRQWETHLLFGFIPRHSSSGAKVTMTLKENYIPWSIYLKRGWSFEPLECGLYLNTVFGDDFWGKEPKKYPGGYYNFSTKLRPNIFLGQRITKVLPDSRRKTVKSITLFYEVSSCDIYIRDFFMNKSISLTDILSLSLGVKLQAL